MITIGYSTRSHKPEFIEYLKTAAGHPKVQIIEKVNNGEKSLNQVYNEIIEESEFEIVVLCHDDIYFDSKNLVKKIQKHFDKTDFGILGVAGTTQLPKSGMWWENRKKMCGIVNHEHNGNKWESRYCDDINNQIKSVCLIDGLFIALHKSRIKEKFNSELEGFHFYDVYFSFRNFQKGVKIGVIFDIRITHLSIGMTNESWELNRKKFVDEYQTLLPVSSKPHDNEKLKIMIPFTSQKTNKEKDVFIESLCDSLRKFGHDVSVVTEQGTRMSLILKNKGFKLYPITEPPGFKLGDGKFSVQTNEGMVLSKINELYPIKEVTYDFILCIDTMICKYINLIYNQIDRIQLITNFNKNENKFENNISNKLIVLDNNIKDYLMEVYEIENKITVGNIINDYKLIYND